MKVIARSENCGGGACPTVYEDEDGSIFVQGYVVEQGMSETINAPAGETVVKISRELLNNLRQG